MSFVLLRYPSWTKRAEGYLDKRPEQTIKGSGLFVASVEGPVQELKSRETRTTVELILSGGWKTILWLQVSVNTGLSM
jgi:hypothetical protein